MADIDTVAGGTGRSATTLELFFDLVYVFAITQVVAFVHHQPTVVGLLEAALLLQIMWWTWSIYTWTTNWTGTASTPIRLFLLATMGASLVMATGVSGAFEESGPLFGSALFAVRVLAASLYYVASKDYPVQRAAFLTFFPLSIAAAGMFLVGGFLEPRWLLILFLGGALLDLISAANAGRGSWAVDASHFAERNGLFIIIALGESVVGVGLTAAKVALDVPHLGAMVVAFAGIAGLWWVYFEGTAPHAERHLASATGKERGRVARDIYSFLHYPMVVGIVIFAVGMEDLVAHPVDPLPLVGRLAVSWGMGLVLLSIVAGYLRATGKVAWEKAGAMALLFALAFVAANASALVFAGLCVLILALSIVVRAGLMRRTQGAAGEAVGASTPAG